MSLAKNLSEKIRNLWIQPCSGWTENTRGRTSAELDAYEARIGFFLPPSYRSLLQLQNGGAIRAIELDGVEQFCVDTFGQVPGPNDVYPITRFNEYVELTCDAQEVQAVTEARAPFHLDRLIIFSSLDGHSVACLDYGYRQHDAKLAPEVCFMTDDGDDFFHFSEFGPRFGNFDIFLTALRLSTLDAKTQVGLFSALAFPALFEQLKAAWQLSLKTHRDDDRYGWFNFAEWHSGPIQLMLDDHALAEYASKNHQEISAVLDWAHANTDKRKCSIHAIFSPNQHLCGTYLDQAHPELAMMIEIPSTWFDPTPALLNKLRDLQASHPALELRWVVCA